MGSRGGRVNGSIKEKVEAVNAYLERLESAPPDGCDHLSDGTV